MHRDAVLVEREQDRLGLDPVDAEADEVRDPVSRGRRTARRRRSVAIAPRDDLVGDAARGASASSASRSSAASSAAAAPKPTIAGTFSKPAAPLALLRAADDQRRDPQPAPDQERADALRPAELVRGDAQQVGAERGEVDRDVAGAGARVDVDEHARGSRAAAQIAATGCSVPTSWLRELHRHERGVVGDRGGDLVGVEAPEPRRRRRA